MASPYSRQALKHSAWHFLTGKFVSAILTLVSILWLVRLLPVAEYGAYVSFTASLELLLSLAPLGLPWLAARYVPEFRLHAAGSQTRRFIWGLLGRFLALLSGGVALAFACLDPFLNWVNLSEHRAVAVVYLLVIVVEGAGRFARDRLLGALMQQLPIRLSLVARQVALLMLLGFFSIAGSVSLLDVIWAELVAATLGTMLALVGLSRHLNRMVDNRGDDSWLVPREGDMWRAGNNMYLARVMTLVSSPQAFILLVQRYLGAEAAAIFGFLRSLYDQIGGYLPANLMFSLVQPKLVASYVGGGGIGELARNANLAGKLSLFALMPLIALTAVSGDALIALASGGKFSHTGLLFFGLMLALIPFSQRLLIETVALTANSSDLCVLASLTGLLILPFVFGLLLLGAGLWSPIIGLGLSYVLFNAIILYFLRRRCGYRVDPRGFYKVVCAAAVASIGGALLPLQGPSWIALTGQTLVVGLVYLAVAWYLKPFEESERSRLNGLINRRVFIW